MFADPSAGTGRERSQTGVRRGPFTRAVTKGVHVQTKFSHHERILIDDGILSWSNHVVQHGLCSLKNVGQYASLQELRPRQDSQPARR